MEFAGKEIQEWIVPEGFMESMKRAVDHYQVR